MHLNIFTFLLFSTLAIAAPTDDDTPASLTVTIPSDIASEFYSALPTSDRARITNLAGAEEVLSEYASSTAWWSSLPSDVKSFATSIAILDSSISANAASASSMITSTATTTTTSDSSDSSSDSPSTSGSNSTSHASSPGASGSSPSTESSTAGAPAATGNVVLGFAGAAGVLGIALVL